MMCRFGCGRIEEGVRTRAVTVWDRWRASERTIRPVRPLAPSRRMCAGGGIWGDMFRGVVGRSGGCSVVLVAFWMTEWNGE